MKLFKEVQCPTCRGLGYVHLRVQTFVQFLGYEILTQAAQNHNVSVEEIVGRSRSRVIVAARDEAIRELQKAGLSLKEIGRAVGGRDHSTVIHALKKERMA